MLLLFFKHVKGLWHNSKNALFDIFVDIQCIESNYLHVYLEFYPPLVHQPTFPQSQEAAVASVPFFALDAAALLPPPQLRVEAGGGRLHLHLELAKEQKVQEQMKGFQ